MSTHPIHAKSPWLSPLCAGIFLVACSGGQTGDGTGTLDDQSDPSNSGTGGELGGQCNWQREPLGDLEDASELGFSAADVLAFAARSFESSFAWQDSGIVVVGPETGVAALQLDIAPAASGKAFVRRQGPPPQGGTPSIGLGDIAYNCAPALEIDVDVSFRTSGGALDETFVTTLVAEYRDRATFAQPITSEALGGGLEVLETRPAGGELRQVQIQATLSPLGTYGTVTGAFDYGDAQNEFAVGGAGAIGSWPADTSGSCANDSGLSGIVLDDDTDLGGYTAADPIAALNALSPASLTWQDQSTTALTLTVTAEGPACARFEQGWQLFQRATVDAVTADARWQGSYAAQVTSTPAEQDLAQVTLRAFLDNVAPPEFESKSGLQGVDVSGYAYGRFDVEVDVDVDANTSNGKVTARGAVVPDCVTNPPEPERDADGNVVGAAGCEGIRLAPVWSGTF